LTENGPCSVNEDGASTTVNPYSWTETAHVLWLDQPAGVGFSYGEETDSNEVMVGEDAYYFLQAFFQTYPEYSSNPLFIVGESYGGHYAPAIAHRVLKGNQASKENTIQLNLAGLGIGTYRFVAQKDKTLFRIITLFTWFKTKSFLTLFLFSLKQEMDSLIPRNSTSGTLKWCGITRTALRLSTRRPITP
jgi:carboxypeptidase C (cathepsin A)